MSAPRRNRARGFTLIEVLVAFAIAAAILVPLLRLFSLGLRTFNNSQAYATASIWAESALDRYGTDDPIALGVQGGELPGRIHWERRTELYHDDAMSDAPLNAAIVPYAVTLTLSWPERSTRRSISFHALRLAPPPPRN
ncbi:MAG TPA: prepilin-type N-terminal cleavage/methylation domain-containing protein [Stellaceae bacterium]|jgi:general secretion pathway protein I|nr:prepilin-type N-terminal cleavage/methylation domain-containing protein [Stellaceae bacterium]